MKQVFTDGAISAEFIGSSIAKHQSKTEIGAHSIFLGQVRKDRIDGNSVKAIEYTAYREMAEKILNEIREDAFEKFSLTCLHIYHSLGRVNCGEICLFVFTSSAHRRDAINACEAIVERIKAEVPLWGKEILDNEAEVWKKENQNYQ